MSNMPSDFVLLFTGFIIITLGILALYGLHSLNKDHDYHKPKTKKHKKA